MCLGICVCCVCWLVLRLSLVCVLWSCFLCGWSCLGLCVRVWCVGCWVIWCVSFACVPLLGVLGLYASFLVFWCFGFFFRCVCVLVSVCAVCVGWCCVCLWCVFCGLVSCVAGLAWGYVSVCGVLVVGLSGVCPLRVFLYWVCWVPYVWCGVFIGLLYLVFWFLVFAYCVARCVRWVTVLRLWLVVFSLCWCVAGFGVWACVVFCFWVLAWFCFWGVAGVLFFVGRLRAGWVGGLFLLVVWVVFLCWGWWVASYFFGAILFVLVVAGLSGFLLASASCLVLQPVLIGCS
jgi:hypothetical protein